MGKGFKTGPGSTNILNFRVVGNPKPADPDRTVIWIDTDVKIPCWALAADNPYIAYHDVDLMANLKLGDGYISDNGSITSPTSSSPERHTEDYIPVEHGKNYVYDYTVSATNSMWLAVVEYTQSEEGYSFSKRIVLVSSVSGTSQTGTYTPSSSNVKAVRLSWRTFPNISCSISLVSKNVPYTIDGTENGSVFIQTGYGSSMEFNVLRKNNITVYPLAAFQYVEGAWTDKPAQIGLNGEWEDWTFFLFKAGVGLADGFTGFTNAVLTDDLITMTIKTSSESTKYSISNEKVDVTNYKTAFFEIQKASFSGASGYNQRAHVHVGEAKAQIGNSISGGSGTFITDGAIAVDISALSGEVDVKASAYSSDEDTVTFKILIKNIYFR